MALKRIPGATVTLNGGSVTVSGAGTGDFFATGSGTKITASNVALTATGGTDPAPATLPTKSTPRMGQASSFPAARSRRAGPAPTAPSYWKREQRHAQRRDDDPDDRQRGGRIGSDRFGRDFDGDRRHRHDARQR